MYVLQVFGVDQLWGIALSHLYVCVAGVWGRPAVGYRPESPMCMYVLQVFGVDQLWGIALSHLCVCVAGVWGRPAVGYRPESPVCMCCRCLG